MYSFKIPNGFDLHIVMTFYRYIIYLQAIDSLHQTTYQALQSGVQFHEIFHF